VSANGEQDHNRSNSRAGAGGAARQERSRRVRALARVRDRALQDNTHRRGSWCTTRRECPSRTFLRATAGVSAWTSLANPSQVVNNKQARRTKSQPEASGSASAHLASEAQSAGAHARNSRIRTDNGNPYPAGTRGCCWRQAAAHTFPRGFRCTPSLHRSEPDRERTQRARQVSNV
jgi:hypothetical protein